MLTVSYGSLMIFDGNFFLHLVEKNHIETNLIKIIKICLVEKITNNMETIL